MTFEELLENSRKEKQRKVHTDREHKIQCACVRWFRLQYPKLSKCLFAVPNGGKRDATTAAKMKAEGQLAGVADIIFLYPNQGYHALLIEMKTAKGRQSELQKEWEKHITQFGYKYIVCHSFEEFSQSMKDYINEK